MTDQRSPFGDLLRYHRRRLGMSQEGLAKHIVELGATRPEIAALGVIGEKAIANLEMPRHDPAAFVRPRPATVRLLSVVFGLKPGTKDYTTFWRAAGLDEPPPEPEPPAESSIAPDQPNQTMPAGRELPGFVADGREVQLAQVVGALDDALSGHPRVVFVGGEPGIGKTSLVAEVARRAVAAHPRLVVIWSECTGKFGATDAFQPVRQALNIMIGDARAASPPQLISTKNQQRLWQRAPAAIQALATVGDGLVERFVSSEKVIAQADALGVRPGSWHVRLRQLAHRPPSAQNAESDEQFVRLLQLYADDGPVLLVLEDLHWANQELARLMFHLLRRLRGQTTYPILIIGSYRPAELVQGYGMGPHPITDLLDEAHQMFESPVVDLTPTLGSAPGRAFVNGIIDREENKIGPTFRDLVFARTGGHPYFTLELLRWFRAHGILTQDAGGTWRVGVLPTEQAIPEGISAVIRARLGSLSPDVLHLLRLASVQGEVFAVDVLAEIVAGDPAAISAQLDGELVRHHHILASSGVGTTAGRRLHQYRFSHALFQEYIYTSLTPAERERFHGQTADAMLRLFGFGRHEAEAEIAIQFDRAGRRLEAATAYKEAADYSSELLEFESAARFYRQALASADPDGMARLAAWCRVGLANCGRELGFPTDAVEQAERAIALAQAEKLTYVEGYSLFVLGLLDYDAGRYARAAARLAAAIPLLERDGDDTEACRARTMLSHVLYGQGAYDEALRQAENAAAMANRLHDDWRAIDAQVAIANCQSDLGHFREAIESYQRGATRARAIGHRRALGLCLVNTGLARLERGEWELATDSLEDVLTLTKDGSMPRTRATAETYLGLVAEGRGDMALAGRHFTEAAARRRAAGQDVLARDAFAGLLRVAIAEGDLPRVRQLHTELADWLRERGASGIEFPVRLYLSLYQAEIAMGDEAAAGRWLLEAQTLLDERTSHITDEAARQSYREQVPVHRELSQLLAQHSARSARYTRPIHHHAHQ